MINFPLIIHLFGVILGMGGALASDAMFFTSIKDGVISKTELRFMKLGSKLVWTGLAIIVLSGAYMVYAAPGYLSLPKFQLKLTVVAVIVLNGIVFHLYHIPRMQRVAGQRFFESAEFMRGWPWLLASGAISFTSWATAFLLGAVGAVSMVYWQGLLVYLAVLAGAITGAMLMKIFVFPRMIRLDSQAALHDPETVE